MSTLWENHTCDIVKFLTEKNETKAHLYMTQLLHFPVDIQDKIIEEISQLPQCTHKDIAKIIAKYTRVS